MEKYSGIDTTVNEYNLGELPFKTMQDFTAFDYQLKTKQSFRNDMVIFIIFIFHLVTKNIYVIVIKL